MNLKSPEASAPKGPRIVQLQAYKKLRFQNIDRFHDLRVLAIAAISLLDDCRAHDDFADVESVRRVLGSLDKLALVLANDTEADFNAIEGARHG